MNRCGTALVRIPFELSVFLHVLLKSESRIDIFRTTPVRLVAVQYLSGPGLELLDLLELQDLDLPRAGPVL